MPECIVQQSAGPAHLLIFSCWLVYWQVKDSSIQLVQYSRECTPSDLSIGISNLLQLAQAEVVLGQLSIYLASWVIRAKKMQ
jgi:hypothetical protein